MDDAQNKAAGCANTTTAQTKAIQHAEFTKIGRILAELRSGRSLNRFEAERIGDHALNSTIAVLRAEGINIADAWEEVPTRFMGKTARVKRYRYAGGAR